MRVPPKSLILALLTSLAALWAGGCTPAPPGEVDLKIPRGFVSSLEIKVDGRLCRFGPFVGYYFRPEDPKDLSRLRFLCFNEKGFYTKDVARNAQLFEGEAILVTLTDTGSSLPSEGERIHPLLFSEAPPQWLETRPEPQDEFVHFHSCYDAQGPVRYGYWLRHVAVTDFTYNMGERVGPDSPLFHQVRTGVDRNFARIVEFDRGPKE